MSFHEIQFPLNISYGSAGGPGYNNNIIEMDSGAEQRIARWSNAKRKYDVSYGIKTQDDINLVLDFYLARNGSISGFRYKDYTDFTSASNHRGIPAVTDQQIGLGDATTTIFQLVKKYISGLQTKTRVITKPVSNTVIIAFDGVIQESGWSVDVTTGLITFSSAPGEDVVITAGFEFDVPVHFSNDDILNLSVDSLEIGSITNITLIEDRIENSIVSDGFNYGSAKYDAMAESMLLSLLTARVYNLAPTTTSKIANLPATTNLSCGGPYFYIHNSGTESFDLKTYAGVLVTAIAAGETFEVILAKDSGGNKVWFAF